MACGIVCLRLNLNSCLQAFDEFCDIYSGGNLAVTQVPVVLFLQFAVAPNWPHFCIFLMTGICSLVRKPTIP